MCLPWCPGQGRGFSSLAAWWDSFCLMSPVGRRESQISWAFKVKEISRPILLLWLYLSCRFPLPSQGPLGKGKVLTHKTNEPRSNYCQAFPFHSTYSYMAYYWKVSSKPHFLREDLVNCVSLQYFPLWKANEQNPSFSTYSL